uniref:Uncharacterized protein n=1 Tax=Solanum lycopersicum TaxID=4081 RepID=K4AUH0_SOLLC
MSTIYLGAKSLSGSSYYIPSLLSISTVDAIEVLNAKSCGEDIPATTIRELVDIKVVCQLDKRNLLRCQLLMEHLSDQSKR